MCFTRLCTFTRITFGTGTKDIFLLWTNRAFHVKFEELEVIDTIHDQDICESQNYDSTLNFLRETNILASLYLCIYFFEYLSEVFII